MSQVCEFKYIVEEIYRLVSPTRCLSWMEPTLVFSVVWTVPTGKTLPTLRWRVPSFWDKLRLSPAAAIAKQ